ncbi:M20/M25/M40 family metallo-hydrolase [Novosphingobium taihuense]|uniref:Glutamate carboxypeptidase n=1 Tax=Novosphingobium taihuense TaxID=260085 RepID=A0A7W7EUI2_9SPHN|nr:M20/M25/M40 family metallo-hydrolase [Novosphingobium taihuense]MBB4614402.1 glutamate carboxypeptidase [Novosphingobium taihuense]TWH86355.1 glutamate carboxypeptidase [Novosphingobium taihuense]
MRFTIGMVAALALAPANAQAAPKGAEAKMVATIDAEQARTLKFLETMVNQNSGSRNLEGVRKVRDIVVPEFTALGFTSRWIPMEQTGRAGHLVLTHKGRKGAKKLLLIGHLDTVFEPDSPFQTYVLNGDKATGPGVGDDKGGIAVILAAVRAMHAAGTLKGANIEVFLTGDEEEAGSPTEVARADLVAAAKAADVALDFEGLSREDGRDMGSIARRSSQSWSLIVEAKSGHSSGIWGAHAGDGAIYAAAKIVNAFREELPEPYLTLNVGLIAGGAEAEVAEDNAHVSAQGKTNIIASKVVARGDLRTLSPEQNAAAMRKMEWITARSYPGVTSAKITFSEGYPPMAPTAGNKALLARLNTVNATLGLPEMQPLDPMKRGAGDISFIAAYVDGLVGLGPHSTGDHAPGETVDVPSIWTQAKRAALLMTRLSAEKSVR